MRLGADDLEALGEIGAETPNDRQFVVALARGLEVLRAFAPQDGMLGNGEIAARTGLPRPTVSRLTHTLTRLGYLVHSERLGRYALGAGVLSLGYAALANLGARQVARPLMQELADATGLSVSMGSRDRLHAVYVEHCRSESTVTLRLDVGSRIPLATTAMGRALLAGLPEGERDYLLDRAAERHGADWPPLREGVDAALDEFRRCGFTTSAGAWQSDVHAVGVPLAPPDGSAMLAFNCGGPAFLLGEQRLREDLGPRLVNLVRNVEAKLTHG